MAHPNDPTTRSNAKWLWILLIALLGVLLVIWLLNPAGDPEDSAFTEDAEVLGTTEIPVEVPERQVQTAVDDDDAMVTRIEDEAAAGAATAPETTADGTTPDAGQ